MARRKVNFPPNQNALKRGLKGQQRGMRELTHRRRCTADYRAVIPVFHGQFVCGGGRKLIVAPDGTAMPAIAPRFNVDNVLVKALARGFRWRKLLDNGTYSTIKEIAAKEQVDVSYVAEVLRLTLLAPDVIEIILDGRQPPAWQLRRFRNSFPVEWQAQRDALSGERFLGN